MYRGDEDNLGQGQSDGETRSPSDANAPRGSTFGKRSRQWTDAVQRLRILSVDETAKAARCRRSEIERRMERGELPYIQRGTRRYIRQEDLQKMLENEAQLSPESGRRRPRGNGRRVKMNPDDIDPRLRRFFD